MKAVYQDPNIQIPMIVASYRTPSMKTRDARVLDFISSYLSDGKSSKLYKKVVDEKKIALQIGAVGFSQEDYGMYIIYGLPMGTHTAADLLHEIDEEIIKIQTDLISEKDYQKLQNQYENQYVDNNSNVEGIAENLAKYHLLYGDINLINTEIDLYHSISREEIREVANKYLNPNQRLVLDYIPTSETVQN
jgi:predicted Zn-dependent peptidase